MSANSSSRGFLAPRFGLFLALSLFVTGAHGQVPTPYLDTGKPADWWFVFKFNTKSFPHCRADAKQACIFGGSVQSYKQWGQQFVFASSASKTLQAGTGCAGDTAADPVGATFSEVYNGALYYVIWNDQFYDDPEIDGCTKECGSPWGHAKGMLAWNEAGEGVVMQVSTPSWPASGSKKFPRKSDGNTLGCVKDDDVEVSQHFFSLKLSKDDTVKVLRALENASIVTDPANPQIVQNGGPADIQDLVRQLGKKSKSKVPLTLTLSSGVGLISKPSALNVPPWQMVSSLLNGVSLRTATWWAQPEIPSTTAATSIGCWDPGLGPAGAVEIATTGQWSGATLGLTGGQGPDHNHAKIGVATSGDQRYVIFGDMNQQGTLSGQKCWSSQNGRGGTFYVINDATLAQSVGDLIKGATAPVK
jgi:Deoxyribonuclease II